MILPMLRDRSNAKKRLFVGTGVGGRCGHEVVTEIYLSVTGRLQNLPGAQADGFCYPV
jgi:hypothetical protein